MRSGRVGRTCSVWRCIGFGGLAALVFETLEPLGNVDECVGEGRPDTLHEGGASGSVVYRP
jgi:hypothetical protein